MELTVRTELTASPHNDLDDADLLYHLEDLVYRETVSALNSTEYVVENISAV